MKMSRDIGPVHFVGIGGIGMSGIAEVMVNLGYTVQGSDVAENANVQRLRDKGVTVAIGHDAANLGAAQVVVVSSAIRRDNPELKAARERLLPVVRRAEMLGELMRLKQAIAIAGTHGKTTTTSMVAALLDAGGFDPTVINGGIINAYGTNARMGDSDWMVVEADESDGTFVKLPIDVALVTNIDPEHLDHYGSFDRIREAFHHFVENVPFYGFAVMCIDHPEVQSLIGQIEDRRIITYGASPQADIRCVDIRVENRTTMFTVVIRDRQRGEAHTIDSLTLSIPGEHNVLNATGAIAVAHHLGIPDAAIRTGLSGFGGVKRRFTRTGDWNGVDVFDDYGHHPGRNRRRAQGGAHRHHRPRHRGRPAASLYPAPRPVRRILLLLQRRRHRDRRAGLSGRRNGDRRNQRRGAGRGPQDPRSPRRAGAPGSRPTRRDDRRIGAAGRHGDLPRRRLDQPMGAGAAGRTGESLGKRLEFRL